MAHEIDQIYSWEFGSDKALAKAKAGGLTVVYPDEFTLQVDIDDEEAFSLFEKRIEYLEYWYDIDYKISLSPSGGVHRHIYVTMSDAITPMERIFLQLFLGSDPIREILSFQEIKNDDLHPTLFFEKKKNDRA